ncbi:MAG TPA: Ni/Fe hydrogenase subunit alpha [Sedimenticola sp.]|nr:Ni/Fe hydrogenase subunit alpha [Sedimenticola sp.]
MPSKKIDIDVRHITRVEGHGNILVRARDGVIEKTEWQVPEAPRFFEAMVRGCSFQDIQTIVSRICGICSVTHSLAALKALEDALGVEVSEQTIRLRILAHYGEQLESHSLHVGYLAAPDLLGRKSVIPLAASHPDLVRTVIAIHRAGNLIMEKLAGRKTHPVRLIPGGFAMLPTAADLRALKHELEATLPRLQVLAEAVAGLAGAFPAFERDTEYVALMKEPTYPYYHGDIGSSDTGEKVPVREFERVVNEYVTPQSTAKWTRWHRESYMVGALARFNLNGTWLQPLAKATAEALGLRQGCCNPYLNNLAQVVESVHVVERSLQLIDELLSAGIRPETPKVAPRAGVGVGAVEAPRGVLFHKYELDAKGNCLSANMCIPTNQNHANIQQDLEALVPQIIDRERDEIRRLMEMLVRAYDPCISCSTHFLNVEFV